METFFFWQILVPFLGASRRTREPKKDQESTAGSVKKVGLETKDSLPEKSEAWTDQTVPRFGEERRVERLEDSE